MTTDSTTFDQALAVARRLNRRERARLIARLAAELVEPLEPLPPATDAPWAAFWQAADAIGQSPQRGPRSATDEVSAARR